MGYGKRSSFSLTNTGARTASLALVLLFVVTLSPMGCAPYSAELVETQSDMTTGTIPYDPRVGYRPAKGEAVVQSPRVFEHPQLGECYVRTSIPHRVLEANGIELEGYSEHVEPLPSLSQALLDLSVGLDAVDPGDGGGGGSATANVYVPSVWTIEQPITMVFEILNQYTTSISVTCSFWAYDQYAVIQSSEWLESVPSTVPASSLKTVSITKVIPSTSVGLKSGRADITGGLTLSVLYQNQFVQKFGPPAELPSADDMSAYNPNYYWEGYSNDGFAWSPSYKLFHPEEWSLRYLAATWMDPLETYEPPSRIAEPLTYAVNYYMTYDNETPNAVNTAFSDLHIIDPNNPYRFRGVCDEFATLATSMCRSLGIPVRWIVVWGLGFVHALLETWVNIEGTWRWVHSDPTWNLFDSPDAYELYKVKVYAGFDDSKDNGAATVDGSSTNGVLLYDSDIRYISVYTGPNDYFLLRDDGTHKSIWRFSNPATETLETYAARDATGSLKQGSSWGNEYYYCDDVPVSTAYKHGPTFRCALTTKFQLKQLVMFSVKIQMVVSSSRMGDLAVALYDDNKQLIAVLCMYDSWYSWQSQAMMGYYTPSATASAPTDSWVAATKSITWTGEFKFWYDASGPSVWSRLGSGTPHCHATGSAVDPSRTVAYIGFQFARCGSYTYHGSNLRLTEIVLDWKP